MMKRLHAALLGAVGGALIAGTASAETLTLGTRTETTSINPNFYNSSPNTQIADHIFNPLVIFDHQQRMHPGLALSWKAIDNKTWDIKLRRGVKFHDGSPFTADDVIDTFDEAQKLKGVAPTGNYLRNPHLQEDRRLHDSNRHRGTLSSNAQRPDAALHRGERGCEDGLHGGLQLR